MIRAPGLAGCYISERGGHSSRYNYCLFDTDQRPLRKISREQWVKIQVVLREHKTKRRLYSKWLLNLQEVRRLHGNNQFKKLYKKHRQQVAARALVQPVVYTYATAIGEFFR